MVSFKQITYALAVESTLHFKKASELCNVSQSALSAAIGEMETQLGVKIFERNNKHVLITDLGRQVLDKAKTIKVELEELMELSQISKAPLSSPMTLGVIPTIGPYLLPKVLPEVREKYPDFKIKIVEDQSHELVEKVRSGEIDAAILALPYAIDGLMSLEFWQENFYWVTHKDNFPSSRDSILSSEVDLNSLMLLKDGHCMKDHALAACQHKHMKSNFDATSLYTIIQMVAGKLGSTLIPEMAIDQLIQQETELRALRLDEKGPHRTIAIVIRPNYVKTNDVLLLKQIFVDQLTKKQVG